jgi:transposase-like protein
LRFKLNFRDLVEMMAERSLSLAQTTIADLCSRRRFSQRTASEDSPLGISIALCETRICAERYP